MRCVVRLVGEDALPADQAWVIGMTEDGERFLFVKRGALTPAVIEQAWEAGLGMMGTIPAQRRHDTLGMRLVV